MLGYMWDLKQQKQKCEFIDKAINFVVTRGVEWEVNEGSQKVQNFHLQDKYVPGM